MALEMNDLMALKGFDNSMTPYEQYKVGYLQQKHHTSGVGIAGLVLGTVGTAAAIGAWVFGPTYANAKANQAREAANAAKDTATLLAASNQRQLDQLTNLFAAERNERINGDTNISQTITDTISGQQTSSLTAQQAAELSSIQNVQQQLLSNAIMGRMSENPTPVSLYAAPRPCDCPSSCGCNG